MSFLLYYISLGYCRVTSLVSFSVPHWSLSSSFLCFSVWFPSLSISVCHYWALLLFAFSIKFVFWVWVSVYVFIVLPVFLYSCLVVSNWFQLCPPTLLITCMCIYCVSSPLSLARTSVHLPSRLFRLSHVFLKALHNTYHAIIISMMKGNWKETWNCHFLKYSLSSIYCNAY